jgi:hypothetical protein
MEVLLVFKGAMNLIEHVLMLVGEIQLASLHAKLEN